MSIPVRVRWLAGVGLAREAERLARLVRESEGWRRRAITFAAGLVSLAAFAPFFLWPVMFLTLPVLVWLIDGAGPAAPERAPRGTRTLLGAAFADGWWWGFGFFAGGLFWVGEAFLVEAEKFAWALPLAVTLLPAGLALFFGAAAAVARLYWQPGLSRILVLAAALALAEWLRGHVLTGFPWNTLGYALTGPLVLMQSAALLGVYGLTLLAGVIFMGPLVLAAGTRDGGTAAHVLRGFGLASLLLALLALYGIASLSRKPAPMVEGVRLRIVQPSVPQREKWQPDKQRAIFDLHLALSRQNAKGKTDDLGAVTHVFWPEAAMPFRPLETEEALDAIGALLGKDKYLFSGALRVVRPERGSAEPAGPVRVYNSMMVFGAEGGLAALYDKIRLVPFGEFLPLQTWLEAIGLRQLTNLRGGFSTGVIPRPLIEAGLLPRAGILICYEAIFPGDAVQGPERPGVLISATNDGWFGDTTGPRQHFHQARVRAVEEGLPLIRAANNGISAVVDPEGRVLASLGMNVAGVIDSPLPAARPPTPYARFGDALLWIGIVLALAGARVADLRSRRRAGN